MTSVEEVTTVALTETTASGDVNQLKQENETLHGQLSSTKAELETATERLQTLEEQLAAQEQTFARVRLDNHQEYIAECDSLKSDIASLTAELTRLQNELSATPVEDAPGQAIVDGVVANRKIQRVFKIVLVGDSGVGKTTFIRHLCLGDRATNTSSTVGVDFYTKLLTVNSQCTSLKIWDTAGTERFRSITRSYFRDANGVVLVYDVTATKSFSNVRQWMGDILENSEEHVVVMVMGNKTDKPVDVSAGEGRVMMDQGRTLADSYRSLFAEVSALTGAGIVDAVAMMVRAMQDVEDEQIRRIRAGVELETTSTPQKQRCC